MVSDYVSVSGNMDPSDRICAPYTTCTDTEYLKSIGGPVSDHICEPKTDCALIGKYRFAAAVDSNITEGYGIAVNGTDADCRNYTTCDSGYSIDFNVTDGTDRKCTMCPIGSYGVDGINCKLCDLGTYNTAIGQIACITCNDCMDPEGTILDTLVCPDTENCTMGIYSACSHNANSICMHCPSSWKFDTNTRLCTPCKNGYYQHGLVDLETSRCKKCDLNFYCSSRYSYHACQGIYVHIFPA
jgi:hypothetical protein